MAGGHADLEVMKASWVFDLSVRVSLTEAWSDRKVAADRGRQSRNHCGLASDCGTSRHSQPKRFTITPTAEETPSRPQASKDIRNICRFEDPLASVATEH